MRKQLYWLSDEEWRRIEPLLPRGRRGAHRVDDRRVISGIMHMLRSGARWRDCPPEYGPYTTIYNRFNRWQRCDRLDFDNASSCADGCRVLSSLQGMAVTSVPEGGRSPALRARWRLNDVRP